MLLATTDLSPSLVLEPKWRFYVQDVGLQPWLGLAFIIFSFTFNLTNDAGDIAPPTSWIGWGAGTATAVYALYEARKLWRNKVPAPVAATF